MYLFRASGSGTGPPPPTVKNCIFITPSTSDVIFRIQNPTGGSYTDSGVNDLATTSNNVHASSPSGAGLDSSYRPVAGSSVVVGRGVHVGPSFDPDGNLRTNPPNVGIY
jgi:hypothetical protein